MQLIFQENRIGDDLVQPFYKQIGLRGNCFKPIRNPNGFELFFLLIM